ncbi:hypothetical protein ACFY5D_01705 [Paeniglutamicibacter sp. NPDC012692]|uniref:hypothetical protein n=1 Tax=Paeniglutamicibacter sp. NPDC012692 TaxID=3364388 RepID=UPI0036A5909A
MLMPNKAASIILAAALAIGAVSAPAMATEISSAVQVNALSRPNISGVTSGSVNLSWPTHEGDHSYEVRYSVRPDFNDAKMEVKFDSRTIRGLADGTKYYFQYRVRTHVPKTPSGVYERSAWSATSSATTDALFPNAFSSVKTTGGVDSINVRWSKTTNTTHYTVIVADDVSLKENKRVFTNIKGTSFTVNDLNNGSRSGMPTFVQVQAHNKGFHTRSARRITAYPAAPKLSGCEAVTIASQNLMCATCIVPGAKRAHWNTRVKIHMDTIKAEKPDVILIQEGLNQHIPGSKTKAKSMEDLAKRLKAQGYVLERKPEKPGSKQYSNRVAYKKAEFKALKHGVFRIPNAKGEDRRGAAWVLLQSKKTGKQFYAVSVHISPKLPQTGNVSMASSAELINAKLATINKKSLPIVTGGDFNSSYYDSPNSPHTTLVKAGWTDAASSAKRTNYMRATTSQGTGSKMALTYGRIDYIMTKNISGTVSYKNVVSTKNNRIVSQHGSDHHMVVAKIKIK